MISSVLLNSNAILNNFRQISSVQYVPGSSITINVRLINTELDLIRYIPASGATLSLTFKKTDGTDLTKAASELDPGDRSMWTVSLTPAETTELAANTVQVQLTEGANITKTIIYNGLAKNLTSGDC